jgi:hypothetical protein
MRLRLAVLAFVVSVVPALADHTSFLLKNASPVNMTHVYATSVVNRSYGYDLLDHDEVIRPGGTKLVTPRDNRGCMFDVAIRFYGGHVVNRKNLNLCTISILSSTGQGVGVPLRSERPSTYQEYH